MKSENQTLTQDFEKEEIKTSHHTWSLQQKHTHSLQMKEYWATRKANKC